MKVHELYYYTIDMTEEEKNLLREVCLYYCESMQANMSGEEDMAVETYEAYEQIDEEEFKYLDLECYHNALSYWIDTNEEDPNADPTAYWEKRGLAERIGIAIAEAIY